MSGLKLVEARDFLKLSAAFESHPSFNPGDSVYRSFLRYACCVRVGCVVLVLGLIYAIARIVAAHACPYGVWNITGCVDLGGVV